jgi:hypothetical protein
MAQIFDRRWILGENAISYVSERNHIPRVEAWLMLQRLILDDTVHARAESAEELVDLARRAVLRSDGKIFSLRTCKPIGWFEVNSEDLLTAVPLTPLAAKKMGRPIAADWPAIKEKLKAEIEAVGFPDKNGAPGWRTKADVVRFIYPLLGDDEPGRTSLSTNATRMLAELREEMAEKSESPFRP